MATLLRGSFLKLRHAVAAPSRGMGIFKKVREAPNGILFGERLRRPGEKRPKEEWENIWVRWWTLIVVGGMFLYYYRPETRPSRTWAREEALRRIAVIDAERAAKIVQIED